MRALWRAGGRQGYRNVGDDVWPMMFAKYFHIPQDLSPTAQVRCYLHFTEENLKAQRGEFARAHTSEERNLIALCSNYKVSFSMMPICLRVLGREGDKATALGSFQASSR